jgi:hypothetical protein
MSITELHYVVFLGSDWSTNKQGHVNRVKGDFRIFLQNALEQWRIKGIFIIIQPHFFFSPPPPPPLLLLSLLLLSLLLLLIWALQLFVSFGLLSSFLPYFSLHSNLTPILNLHFSRSALTSSISSFLPGCNIVLIFHEPI